MSIGLDSLLNNNIYCFESYIEKQAKFIGQPIYAKIIYKTKLRNIDTAIALDLINKLFITQTDRNLENVTDWINKFKPKPEDTNQFYFNPLIISPQSILKIEIMDQIENPSICYDFLEEEAKQRPYINFRQSMSRSYLGQPDACEVFNKQGYFFLKVTGFENPELFGDYSNFFSAVENNKHKDLKKEIEKLSGAKKFLIQSAKNKISKKDKKKNAQLLKRVNKINDAFLVQYLGCNELVKFSLMFQSIYYELCAFNRKLDHLLDFDKLEKRTREYVDGISKIEPTIEMKTFYMTKRGQDYQLSKYKENVHNRKVKVKSNETV